jgi:hypothetical protein
VQSGYQVDRSGEQAVFVEMIKSRDDAHGSQEGLSP